jgi:membrane protein
MEHLSIMLGLSKVSSLRERFITLRVTMGLFKPASLTWKELVLQTGRRVEKDDVLGRSAQLSFYFFLALFPLLICILGLLGMLSRAGRDIQHGLFDILISILPWSAWNLVQQTLTEISQSNPSSKLSLGIIISLWSASAGMSAVMDTLNAQAAVPETRSFIKRTVLAAGLTIAAALVLLAAVAIVLLGDSAAQYFSQGAITIIWRIVQWPIATTLVLFDFALIYHFAPDVKDCEWHWISPGAASGLVLWMAVSLSLKTYLHFFNTYTDTYGSLGGVTILLLWFYLTGAALLIGAEINTVIEHATELEKKKCHIVGESG